MGNTAIGTFNLKNPPNTNAYLFAFKNLGTPVILDFKFNKKSEKIFLVRDAMTKKKVKKNSFIGKNIKPEDILVIATSGNRSKFGDYARQNIAVGD